MTVATKERADHPQAEVSWEASEGDEYAPIAIESLLAMASVDANVYLKRDDGRFVLYRYRNLPFLLADQERLIEHRVKLLYFRRSEKKEFFRSLEGQIDQLIASTTIAADEKANLLYQSSLNLVEQFFESSDVAIEVQRTKRLVSNYVSFVLQGDESGRSIFALSGHDYYTYKHSVEVCTYSLSLAVKIGIADTERLRSIGLGTIYHDIGKKRIPKELINKPGRLSEAEWELMKQHVAFGIELAAPEIGTDPIAMAIIENHHEDFDGKGYLRSLKEPDLIQEVRVAIVADVFSALTSERAYSRAHRTYDALMIMKNLIGKRIDPDIFRELVMMFREAQPGPEAESGLSKS